MEVASASEYCESKITRVGVAKELRERLDLRQVVLLVLGVRRIHDDLVAQLEPIAVRVAAVALELGPHAQAGDLVLALGLEPHELDRGRQAREIDRERRRGVLAAEGFLEVGVAAVDPDVVAGRVNRHEERKAHDVIPVGVRHERVEALARRSARGEHLVAEDTGAEPRSQSTKSRWPVMISTQEELPPNVWETAKSSSRSRKAAACSGVSSRRPEARISAEISLRRTSADVMATGIEPRVPQNLTLKGRSGGIECRQRLWREPGEPLPDRREHVENHREPADVEDLAHGGLECGHPERAALALACLEASMSTRSPTLLMYSTPPKSRITRSWPSAQRAM
jgi:hypothetical protein